MKREADAVTDNGERARLRLKTEGKRDQKHETHDVFDPQVRMKVRLEPTGVRKALNFSFLKRLRIQR